MRTTQRTGLSFSSPGEAWALWVVVVSLGSLLAASPAQANGHGHKVRLSSDLEAIVHGEKATPADGVDVILSGNSDFIQRVATKHGARIKRGITAGAVLTLTHAQLAAMSNDPDLGAVTLDGEMRSQLSLATESTGASAAWHGEIAKLGKVTGRGIGVAIIDSGVDQLHTALRGKIVASRDFTSVRNLGLGIDENGHGTHVAGIVAAGAPRPDTGQAPVGMAPGAHIVSLKVLDENGAGKASDVIEAIGWVIENKNRYGLRIINMSLGMAPTQSYKDDPVCQAVERAVKAGIVVVVSAGNYGQAPDGRIILGSVTSPGISPYAITVGALRTQRHA